PAQPPRGPSKPKANRKPPGRERCPADVTASVTPVDPGGSPNRVRHPNPPVIVVRHPTPIVEGRPAPVVIALEAPAGVRVDPVPALGVRLKVRAGGRPIRRPRAAKPADHHPLAVRRKSAVESLDRHAAVCTGNDRWLRRRRPRTDAA